MPDALISTSGLTSFNPSFGDFVLEAFSRIQIRPPSLTYDHWFQARMSGNLMQSEWANVGMPMLWKQALIPLTLQPGVSLYDLPANVVAALDAYIRVYQTANPQDFTPIFITTLGSRTIRVFQPAHGYAASQMVWYPISLAASGIILQGSFLIQTVIDEDTYTIEAPSFPDGTNSVALPEITSEPSSSTFSVYLPNHRLTAGQKFFINVPTMVGGAELAGGVFVTAVPDLNHFSIQGSQAAVSASTIVMNGGYMRAQAQQYGLDPIDYILYPISRTEFAAQPDKGPNLQFRPTTFFFIRTRQPQIQFWNPPDNANPYMFFLWAIVQQDDAVVPGGVGVDIPYRFFEAYAAGLAAKLARKYPPPPPTTVAELKAEYDAYPDGALWRALREDVERVPLFLTPGLQAYYR